MMLTIGFGAPVIRPSRHGISIARFRHRFLVTMKFGMFAIRFTPEAIEDLASCRETRNNKRLRPNWLAEWELRVDRFRVFYDIEQEKAMVKIEAIGHKRGNRLYLHGEEFQL